MADFINPFDFKKIFIDTVLGNETIFLFAFVIVYSYFAGRYGFSNKIYLMILAIGILLFSGFYGFSIYIVLIFIIGIIIYMGVSKILT